MRIDEILARGGPVFSFEFFPPKTPAGERNLEAALTELRQARPAFVSVTYGAGGSTREQTIEIVKRHPRATTGWRRWPTSRAWRATVPELRGDAG